MYYINFKANIELKTGVIYTQFWHLKPFSYIDEAFSQVGLYMDNSLNWYGSFESIIHLVHIWKENWYVKEMFYVGLYLSCYYAFLSGALSIAITMLSWDKWWSTTPWFFNFLLPMLCVFWIMWFQLGWQFFVNKALFLFLLNICKSVMRARAHTQTHTYTPTTTLNLFSLFIEKLIFIDIARFLELKCQQDLSSPCILFIKELQRFLFIFNSHKLEIKTTITMITAFFSHFTEKLTLVTIFLIKHVIRFKFPIHSL